MKKYKVMLLLLVAVLLIQVVLGAIIYFSIGSWSDRGTFGDMFGVVNCLFSGFAFAGVIYAILLQSKELELQRNELELTRNELKSSAQAQQQQVETMRITAYINAMNTLIQTYTEISTRYGSSGTSSTEKAKQKSEELVGELERLIKEFNNGFHRSSAPIGAPPR